MAKSRTPLDDVPLVSNTTDASQHSFFTTTQRDISSRVAPWVSTLPVSSNCQEDQYATRASSSLIRFQDFSNTDRNALDQLGSTESMFSPHLAEKILMSYGLEKEDLNELLDYPDDQTTAERLPYTLQEIRKKKAMRGAHVHQSGHKVSYQHVTSGMKGPVLPTQTSLSGLQSSKNTESEHTGIRNVDVQDKLCGNSFLMNGRGQNKEASQINSNFDSSKQDIGSIISLRSIKKGVTDPDQTMQSIVPLCKPNEDVGTATLTKKVNETIDPFGSKVASTSSLGKIKSPVQHAFVHTDNHDTCYSGQSTTQGPCPKTAEPMRQQTVSVLQMWQSLKYGASPAGIPSWPPPSNDVSQTKPESASVHTHSGSIMLPPSTKPLDRVNIPCMSFDKRQPLVMASPSTMRPVQAAMHDQSGVTAGSVSQMCSVSEQECAEMKVLISQMKASQHPESCKDLQEKSQSRSSSPRCNFPSTSKCRTSSSSSERGPSPKRKYKECNSSRKLSERCFLQERLDKKDLSKMSPKKPKGTDEKHWSPIRTPRRGSSPRSHEEHKSPSWTTMQRLLPSRSPRQQSSPNSDEHFSPRKRLQQFSRRSPKRQSSSKSGEKPCSSSMSGNQGLYSRCEEAQVSPRKSHTEQSCPNKSNAQKTLPVSRYNRQSSPRMINKKTSLQKKSIEETSLGKRRKRPASLDDCSRKKKPCSVQELTKKLLENSDIRSMLENPETKKVVEALVPVVLAEVAKGLETTSLSTSLTKTSKSSALLSRSKPTTAASTSSKAAKVNFATKVTSDQTQLFESEATPVTTPKFVNPGKPSPPTMLKLKGNFDNLTRDDVVASMECFGKTKSFLMFKSKQEATVCFERAEDAAKLKSKNCLEVKGVCLTVVQKQEQGDSSQLKSSVSSKSGNDFGEKLVLLPNKTLLAFPTKSKKAKANKLVKRAKVIVSKGKHPLSKCVIHPVKTGNTTARWTLVKRIKNSNLSSMKKSLNTQKRIPLLVQTVSSKTVENTGCVKKRVSTTSTPSAGSAHEAAYNKKNVSQAKTGPSVKQANKCSAGNKAKTEINDLQKQSSKSHAPKSKECESPADKNKTSSKSFVTENPPEGSKPSKHKTSNVTESLITSEDAAGNRKSEVHQTQLKDAHSFKDGNTSGAKCAAVTNPKFDMHKTSTTKSPQPKLKPTEAGACKSVSNLNEVTTPQKKQQKAIEAPATSVEASSSIQQSMRPDLGPTAQNLRSNTITVQSQPPKAGNSAESVLLQTEKVETTSHPKKDHGTATNRPIGSLWKPLTMVPAEQTATVPPTHFGDDTSNSTGESTKQPLDFKYPTVNASMTPGEEIEWYLNPQKLDCLTAENIFSSRLVRLYPHLLLITKLPTHTSTCYTEEDLANLLCKFGFEHVPNNLYVIPQRCIAFALMPNQESVMELVRASACNQLIFRQRKLDVLLVRKDILTTPLGFYESLMGLTNYKLKDDGGSIIYIQNISPNEAIDLKVALRKIGSVRNYLPLLNKVFVEFESVCDADRLGVWYSLRKPGLSHTVERLKTPRTLKKSQPPKLPLNALPESNLIIPGAEIPSTKYGIPQGTTGPFWITMTTAPYVFPTESPWFNIPDFLTVQGKKDISTTKHPGYLYSTVMLTNLPEDNYTHEDVANLVWPYFSQKNLQTLYYNVLVLPLQRRAFVFFSSRDACCSFVRDHMKRPVSVKGSTIGVHLVLQDIHSEPSEEHIYKMLMKWSNIRVANLGSLEERLLSLEILEANLDLIKGVMNKLASLTSFVNFLVLANRICIEMIGPRNVKKVLEQIPPKKDCSADNIWSKIGHVQSMKRLKKRLHDSKEVIIILDMDNSRTSYRAAAVTDVEPEPRTSSAGPQTASKSKTSSEGVCGERPEVTSSTQPSTEASEVAEAPDGASESKTVPSVDCSQTVGERIGSLLPEKIGCLIGKPKLSELSSVHGRLLLISNLPKYEHNSYTESHLARLLQTFGFQYEDRNIYVIPQACLAFFFMPGSNSARKILEASKSRSLHFKGSVLNVDMVNKRILMTTPVKDDGQSTIYIQNISMNEARDLRESLRKIDCVKNFLPLLSKVFIEFESLRDADRLGVWYSLLRCCPAHKVYRIKLHRSTDTSLAPRLAAKALPDSRDLVNGAVIPTTNFGVPQGSAPPFAVTMTTAPFVFPTASPWFIIPDFTTVRDKNYLWTCVSLGPKFSTIMLTGLPEGGYSHKDVAKLLWPHFAQQNLQTLYYNIIVLPLQRRAFVFFENWKSCTSLLEKHLMSPFSVKDCNLHVHLVLQDMSPGATEETMYRRMMKWSNSHVPELGGLEERLLLVEVDLVSVPIIMTVMEAVTGITPIVSFLPLANRICIEMMDCSSVTRVVHLLADKLPAKDRGQVVRVESVKSLKERLQSEAAVTLDLDTKALTPIPETVTPPHISDKIVEVPDQSSAPKQQTPPASSEDSSAAGREGPRQKPTVKSPMAPSAAGKVQLHTDERRETAAEKDELPVPVEPKDTGSVGNEEDKPSVSGSKSQNQPNRLSDPAPTAKSVVQHGPTKATESAGIQSPSTSQLAPLTPGEKIQHFLMPKTKLLCLNLKTILSPRFVSLRVTLAISNLPEYCYGCYTQADIAHLLLKLEIPSDDDKIFILPQCRMAFVFQPNLEKLQQLFSAQTVVTLKGCKLVFRAILNQKPMTLMELYRFLMSFTNFKTEADPARILYIQNISQSEARALREELRKTAGVINFLPLLNKVFVEFRTALEANRLNNLKLCWSSRSEQTHVALCDGQQPAAAPRDTNQSQTPKKTDPQQAEQVRARPKVKGSPERHTQAGGGSAAKQQEKASKSADAHPRSDEAQSTKAPVKGPSDTSVRPESPERRSPEAASAKQQQTAPSPGRQRNLMNDGRFAETERIDQPVEAFSAPPSFLTHGQKIQHILKPSTKLDVVHMKTILSPSFSCFRFPLVIANLPEYHDGLYTEADVIELLQKHGLEFQHNFMFVVPQCRMAFVLKPDTKKLQGFFRRFSSRQGIYFKGSKLSLFVSNYCINPNYFGIYKLLMDISRCDLRLDPVRVIHIQNISQREIKELEEVLKEIGDVINFLPLLNRVFIEFRSSADADRLGVWYSLLKHRRSHLVFRTEVPKSFLTANPPSRPAQTLVDKAAIVAGATIPKTDVAIPEGTTAPFWITMTTSSYLFPTASPWFNIPESRKHWAQKCEGKAGCLKLPIIMLTGFRNSTYTQRDVAKVIWKYFPGQNPDTLDNNVVVLPLQRRAFVFFSSLNECERFSADRSSNLIPFKGYKLHFSFVCEQMELGGSEKSMYRALMKWSNIHVPDLTSLEERLLCVEVLGTNVRLVQTLMKEIKKMATFTNFLTLANRVYIEMAESNGVGKVVENMPACKLSMTYPWKEVGHVESLKSRKQRLQDSEKIPVNLATDGGGAAHAGVSGESPELSSPAGPSKSEPEQVQVDQKDRPATMSLMNPDGTVPVMDEGLFSTMKAAVLQYGRSLEARGQHRQDAICIEEDLELEDAATSVEMSEGGGEDPAAPSSGPEEGSAPSSAGTSLDTPESAGSSDHTPADVTATRSPPEHREDLSLLSNQSQSPGADDEREQDGRHAKTDNESPPCDKSNEQTEKVSDQSSPPGDALSKASLETRSEGSAAEEDKSCAKENHQETKARDDLSRKDEPGGGSKGEPSSSSSPRGRRAKTQTGSAGERRDNRTSKRRRTSPEDRTANTEDDESPTDVEVNSQVQKSSEGEGKETAAATSSSRARGRKAAAAPAPVRKSARKLQERGPDSQNFKVLRSQKMVPSGPEPKRSRSKSPRVASQLPPYNSNNPLGEEFVTRKRGYYCNLCSVAYLDDGASEHCRSQMHCDNVMKFHQKKQTSP